MEKYLISIRNLADRIALTKFRLSNHTLMIEKGRHMNTPQMPDRKCPFCPNEIENESHFLLDCPTYSLPRKTLLDQVNSTIIGFRYPQEKQSFFLCLLRCPIISHFVAHFIRQAMQIRAFLSTTPRNSN